MTTLQLPVDDRWLLRAGQTAAELTRDLRELLAAKLFEVGRLTLGQAAELAGQPVWLFMETLSRLAVSVINLDDEQLQDDLSEA